MDPINIESNNWFTKIKKIPARYWLTALILLADIFMLIPVFYGGIESVGIVLFLLPLSLPIAGLLRQERWANVYIWFIIVGLVLMDFMALAFSGDFYHGSIFNALIPFFILVLYTFTIIILNIKSTPKKI